MGAQVICEGYRTQEDKRARTYVAAVTITYFNDVAQIQLLSGTITTRCWRELYQYFQDERPNVRQVHYMRADKLTDGYVQEVVWINPKM